MVDRPLSTEPSPLIAAPPPFVDRRGASRRAADRQVHEERRLLALSVDVLATPASAHTRLGQVLRLIGDAVRAERVALLSDQPERRVAVVVAADEDTDEADSLAAWLDAAGPRSRAARAAANPAPVVRLVVPRLQGVDAAAGDDRGVDHEPTRHLLELPNDSGVLGFDLGAPLSSDLLAEKLPSSFVRSAAALLAVVSRDAAAERELAELRAKEVERTGYVSTVAHELRTPLTGLRGYLDLILDGKVDDPDVGREFLERGRGIIDSITELVGDLLEVSRLDAGSIALELAPFSLAEVGGRVVQSLDAIAMDRGIAITADLPPRMRMAVADRRRVEQVLINLVGNALKYSPAGGEVRLGAWTEGSVCVFVVRDDGDGISVEDRARIFERFYRMADHEKVTGTGLGLPIARDLARAMGGELDVASVPGAGSAFVLVLPGPAGTTAEDLELALDQLLAAEEVALEERAVLRALDAAGRIAPSRPRGLPMEPGGDRGQGTKSRRRRPRLRALDGGVRTTIRPSPA
jgi:signal transduction histidine kinase